MATPAVDFEDGAIVRAGDLDAAVDQVRDRSEELGSELGDLSLRTPKFPAGEIAGTFPAASDRAGKFAVWNSDGSPGVASGALAVPALAVNINADSGNSVQDELDLRPVFDVRAMIGGDGEIAATLAQIAANGGHAVLAPGNYTIAAETEIGSLHLTAHKNAFVTPAVGFAGTRLLKSTGSLIPLPNLAADVAGGDLSLSFVTAPAVSAGDWINLRSNVDGSWLATRSYYREGEWCQVESVAGTTVNLTSRLIHSYSAANMALNVLVPNKPRIQGGHWNSGAYPAFKFTACTGPLFEGISGTAQATEFAYVDRCVATDLSVGSVTNHGAGGGNDYGVLIGNSHKVNLTGTEIYGRRHAVAIGGDDVAGAVPNRFVSVSRLLLSNSDGSGVYTTDFHGNSEFCEYSDCTISGGIGIGGKDNGYTSCRVGQQGSTGWCAEISEAKGGRLYANSCTFTTYASAPTNGTVFDLGYNSAVFSANVTDDVTIDFSGSRLFAGNLAAGTALGRFSNNGNIKKVNFIFDRLELSVPGTVQVLKLAHVSGVADSDAIIVDNIKGLKAGSFFVIHETSDYLNFPHRLPVQRGNYDATTTATTAIIAPDQTYPVSYPRAPHASVVLKSQSGEALSDFHLGSTGIPKERIYSATSTAIRPAVEASANFGTVPFRLQWEVSIREV